MNLGKIASIVINYCFYALFFLIPLLWLPFNSELFEFNKMIFVYILTTIVMASWLLKGLSEGKLAIKRTPLDLPILFFLIANILATIFSIDPHTSLFGYYSRFHGGLLSTFSYILLYYVLVSNTDKKEAFNYFFTLLFSSFLVAVYGVLQHPNPLFQEKLGSKTIFHGIDYDYWAVNVEERVFSTLGQPNWLAAFLAMTLFPLTAFLFIFKKNWQKALVFVAIVTSYLAFTFTYSRGGLIGLLLGTFSFLVVIPFYKKTWWKSLLSNLPLFKAFQTLKAFREHYFSILGILALIITANFFFGNAIDKRGGLNPFNENNTQGVVEQKTKATSLENPNQQTSKIRTIVWNGSVEIFKHYPILGTGVETFGYSYYLFKPIEHNLTIEWDYIYNKAHNEYVNYLATTGAVGLLSYLILIGLFEFLIVRYIITTAWSSERLLSIGIFAGYNSYLGQNFFGFSVVPIAVLFFLYPAFFFLITQTLDNKSLHLEKIKLLTFLKTKFYNFSLRFVIVLLAISTLVSIGSLWVADFYYNKSLSDGSYEGSINSLRVASKLAPYEPIYQAELAQNLSGLALGLKADQTKKSSFAQAKTEARELIDQVVRNHPNNISLWQTRRIVDFNLAKVDRVYNLDLLTSAEKIKELAPTDASLQYEAALVYSFVEKKIEAERQLEYVLKLKPDYKEAVITLASVYVENNKFDKALKLLRTWLDRYPNDPEASDLLKTLLTG